jgi:hypothetical protein
MMLRSHDPRFSVCRGFEKKREKKKKEKKRGGGKGRKTEEKKGERREKERRSELISPLRFFASMSARESRWQAYSS